MTRKSKVIDRFLKNPTSVRYEELAKVLEHYGFLAIAAKGSHIKFKHTRLTTDLIIPVHNGDCKDFYKKLALKLIISL